MMNDFLQTSPAYKGNIGIGNMSKSNDSHAEQIAFFNLDLEMTVFLGFFRDIQYLLFYPLTAELSVYFQHKRT